MLTFFVVDNYFNLTTGLWPVHHSNSSEEGYTHIYKGDKNIKPESLILKINEKCAQLKTLYDKLMIIRHSDCYLKV